MKLINVFNNIGKFFSENWEPILTVTNILLTVLIAFFAHRLTQNNNSLLEKEMYPHFRVIETTENPDNDGFYCDAIIRIRNHGGNYYSFNSTARTYISYLQEDKEYLLPLRGYYYIHSKPYEGDIVATHFYPGNNYKVATLIKTINERLSTEKNYGHFGGLKTFIKVEYQDVQGKYKTQYFKADNSELIDSSIGEKYVDLFDASAQYNDKTYSFDIDDVSEELLFEFATTALKDAYAINQ